MCIFNEPSYISFLQSHFSCWFCCGHKYSAAPAMWELKQSSVFYYNTCNCVLRIRSTEHVPSMLYCSFRRVHHSCYTRTHQVLISDDDFQYCGRLVSTDSLTFVIHQHSSVKTSLLLKTYPYLCVKFVITFLSFEIKI